MSTELLQREQKEFQEVSEVDGPGRYKLSSGITFLPIFGHLFSDKLMKKNPSASAIRFNPATLIDEEYTPASLEYLTNIDSLLARGINAIVVNSEIYELSGDFNSSNGNGRSSFYIKDIGNLSVVKNKLVIDKPKKRDGKFDLYGYGSVVHFSRAISPGWSAQLTIEGEKPGKLVTGTIDILNHCLKTPGDRVKLEKEQ